MDKNSLLELLEAVKEGKISPDEGVLQLKNKPFDDLGYAKVDHHRRIRQGIAEVIYGEGKTVNQIKGIVENMISNGQKTILITRLDESKAEELDTLMDFKYYPIARVAIVGIIPKPVHEGLVVVATGGTSDMNVAEEASLTLEALGNRVVRLYDVGVSGIHRLLSSKEEVMKARVIVAVAGMEGALASVVGGLADCPVIAVPTSVGYGAAFGGLAALLSMLNSCASGVSVVNIDNGFGAGYLASMINHMKDVK